MLSNFLFSKPKNVGNAKCRPTINRVSTNYYGPTIGQLSAKCRRSVGEMSAKCRRSVGERKAISAETHLERLSTVSRPSVDPLSTDYRPTIDRYVDRVSTECRPSIDGLSTECRPTIDRVSTEYRPTVDRVSTAISTDISVDITHSKQDPEFLPFTWANRSVHGLGKWYAKFTFTFCKNQFHFPNNGREGLKLESKMA